MNFTAYRGIYVSGYGQHRLTWRGRAAARLRRATGHAGDILAGRPVAALLVAAGTGFATSGVIEFLRLVK